MATQAFAEALRATPPAEHAALAPVLPPDFLARAAPRAPQASARARAGRTPVLDGPAFIALYFTVNDTPAEVLKVMDLTTGQQLEALQRGQRTLSVYVLLVLGLAGFALDYSADFQAFVFGYAGVVCWVAALVLNRARAGQRAALLANASARGWFVVPAVVLSLVALAFVMVGILKTDTDAALLPAGALTLLLVVLVRERSSRSRLGIGSPFDPRFEDARRLFATLKDDLPRKYPLLGWLDLTGLTEAKAANETLSDGGAPVTFYRDEWLRLKLKLKNGNVLRVSAIESVRKKKGFFKQGMSKRKWKPGSTNARHELRISILVDRERHQLKTPENQQLIGQSWVDAQLTRDDQLVVRAAAPERMSADDLLRLLKHAYDHVTPRTAAV